MSRGICCALLLSLTTGPVLAEKPLPRVPEGFTVERVASAPLVEHPLMAGFDDRGRLYIAESAGMNLKAAELLENPPNFIRRLEDTDGDGVFDRSTIFADKLTFPQGALWYRDALYVASPPYIWRLEDTDDDGVADKRTILVKSFGFTGNAADIHGCFLSPGGRLFWCDGRHGHEFFDERGQLVSKGKAARIFSSRIDGSDVRVWCGGGMDNPVEVDFTETGDVIGTVNILYGQPRIDALVHWIEHGVYPRADQGDCIAEFDYTGELLPPIARLGHVAVSGTTRYRSEEFGPEYRDNYMISVFNTHRIVRSKVTPSGSTYTSTEEDFLVSDDPDFHPTDVLEDADGSLLVIDTGGWFRIGCPTSQIAKPELLGAIYRVRREGAHTMDDPRGQAIAWKTLPVEELVGRLDDERFVVRERAIDELSLRTEFLGRNRLDALRELWEEISARGRRNLLWSIQRSELSPPRRLLEYALLDPNESVRLVALRCLADSPDRDNPPLPAVFLGHAAPAERRVAATILARQTPQSFVIEPTQVLLDVFSDKLLDRHLEHAVVHALMKIGDVPTMRKGLASDSTVVRRNLLVALAYRGEMTAAEVLPLLDTSDPLLRAEALRLVQGHPEWIAEMKPRLRGWLSSNDPKEIPIETLRGFLLATIAQDEIRETISGVLREESTSEFVRLFLLELLEQTVRPDDVAQWSPAIERGLGSDSKDILRQTLRLARLDAEGTFDDRVTAIAVDEHQDDETRLIAIQAVGARWPAVPEPAFAFLLASIAQPDNTLRSLRGAETLAGLPAPSEPQTLRFAAAIDGFPPHALPALSEYVLRTGREEVRRTYLKKAIREGIADRFSDADLAVWSEAAEATRELVAELRRLRERSRDEQRQKLESLAGLLDGGNSQKGEQVFQSRTAACAGCHRIGDQGGQVGPDLSRIGQIRTPRDLLEAIVYPSSSLARGYESFTVVTGDGRIHNGLIPSETSSEIVLRTADLREYRLRRDDIEHFQPSPTSIMPQGIDKLLTPDELRDLIAYLRERK